MLVFILCTLLTLNVAVEGKNIPESRAAVTITYTLWLNEEGSDNTAINLSVEEGITFYEVMNIASESNSDFRFTSIESQYGNFITSIGGVENDSENNLYWFIYVLNDLPNLNSKPSNDWLATTGVDGIRVEEGANYLFWYTTADGKFD